MIRRLLLGLSQRMRLIHVRMRFSEELSQIGRLSARKVLHLLAVACRAVWALIRNRPAILYYPPAGPTLTPILRDAVLLPLIRPFALRTVFHFEAAGVADYLHHRKWLRLCTRAAYRSPDAAVVLSQHCTDDANAFGARSIYVVPNGSDIPRPEKKRVTRQTLRILFLGTHTETKGIRDALRTVARLRDMGVPSRLHTVGQWDGKNEEAACRRLVQDLALDKHVTFHGWLEGDRKWQEYGNADAFLFPSFFPMEACSVALIEAAAFGLPTVASSWRGNADVVLDGVTGFIHSVHDVAGYARSLAMLAGDAELRRRLGNAARKHYEQNFTEARYLERMEAVLRKVADS